MRYTNLLFTYLLIIIKVLSKITIKHKTMLKCEVKSYIKIYKKIFYGQAWGPLDPGGPWHLSSLVQWMLRHCTWSGCWIKKATRQTVCLGVWWIWVPYCFARTLQACQARPSERPSIDGGTPAVDEDVLAFSSCWSETDKVARAVLRSVSSWNWSIFTKRNTFVKSILAGLITQELDKYIWLTWN